MLYLNIQRLLNVSIGETRADDICDWKLQVRIGETLDKLIPKLVPG